MLISDKLLIEVFYLGGEDPFICGVNGKITTHCLSEIEDVLTSEDDPFDFDKGEGLYFFTVYRESAQCGFEGRIEIDAYWDFTFVRYEPIPEAG